MPRTVGVDTGGTFTDLVLEEEDGGLTTAKLPSSPRAPAQAVVEGLAMLGGTTGSVHVVHGTTVALNALLTHRTARVALIVPAGFRDLVEIGRQDRPSIYALHPVRPAPLVPRELRFEVNARAWPDLRGDRIEVVRRPSRAELAALRSAVKRAHPESIAVCLLHSYADPSLEEAVAAALRPLGVPITCSSGIVPEHREHERFSTAMANAALVPLMSAYLGGLQSRLGGARLSLLQSSGGTLPAEQAALEPVRVLLSGPAGGVVGASRAALEAGFRRIVTLDMGGTSTDVAFWQARDEAATGDEAATRNESANGARAGERASSGTADPVLVAGHPIAVPSLDIQTIGCGGGSLVTVDEGGVLHVGPGSAGADPGPVCYGRSDVPTVTDAHVLLGHIAEGAFLDGGLPLDHGAVRLAFESLGRRLGVRPEEAARGVLEVARAAMRRAIGVMTMQRGHDPRALLLVAFGGAGGLHAAALASSLGMQGALVPVHPGCLSASGMARAAPLRDLSRTILAPLDRWPHGARGEVLRELADEGEEALVHAGWPRKHIETESMLELRYAGQSFEIRLPEGLQVDESFHRAHERLYGYRLEDRAIELVCLRVRARIARDLPALPRPRAKAAPATAYLGSRTATLSGRTVDCPIVARAALSPGHEFEGPALVEEYSGTILVPPRWSARLTAGGHVLLSPSQRRKQ